MSQDRRPAGEILGDLSIHPLEPGWVPTEAFLLIKCRDEGGAFSWAYRTTHAPNREELLGALVVHVDLLRKEIREDWESE